MSSKESVTEFRISSENEDDKYLEFSLTQELAKLNINDISPPVPAVNYCIPEFSCHQSQEEFIFVLKVTDLDKESIKINFGNKELKASPSCCITCTSNSGKFPNLRRNDYSLFLRFLPECLVQPGKELVTVSELNAVICLSKHEDSSHHWEYFYYGLDADNATYQELLTVSALQHKLDILQKETNRIIDAKQGVPDDEVQISLIDDEIVEFIFEENEEIDPSNVNDSNGHEQSDSNEESCKTTNGYHDESTADSGINGEQQNDYSASSVRGPAFRRFRSFSECTGEIQLKGILKHGRRRSQTVSESSDDFSWSSQDCPGVDSDIPEEDISDASRTKKSVHFNDNVYRSFFRSNSSILGQREKNRRKQKKKLELRRRRSSEGDSSSGVETDERIDVPQKMSCIISVAPLDINQNHSSSSDSSGETSNCMERLDNDLPRADCDIQDNIQDISQTNGDRKRRRKKKGNLRSDDYDESNGENLDNTILVLTSSPESHMYQRHRRYFSRHRQTSI